MWTLGGFNTADPEAAMEVLTACCASRAWAEKLATGRPYGSLAALKAAALAGFDELDEAEVAAAHAAHPPIGGRSGSGPEPARNDGDGPAGSRGGARHGDAPAEGRRGQRPGGDGKTGNGEARSTGEADAMSGGPAGATEAAWSRGEQARAMTADESVRAELAEANAAYERRFGRVFLICATGLTAEEILAEARRRLRNDDPTERAEARAELRKIVALRLDKAFGIAPGSASRSASGRSSGEVAR
ncbi:2-oxo-4-hydroxy-4-carboxy-5-ureidoimidazoline decarboxylase [Glycomyces albidus]|nr:2-oxo-4-hydroxy-4-carboxy-5-ureidoimidazoline decarboxylase [Glycomyces albidus]